MAVLGSLYIKKDVLETLLKGVNAKGDKGIELTISINNETNDYGQNISSYVSQSKEQRDSKKQKYFTGNGKVFWTDNTVSVAVKKEDAPKQSAEEISDLPF